MKKQPPNKKRTALKRVPPEQPRKKKPSEVEQPNRPLLKRVVFGEEKPDLTELEAGSTTILDILSPTTVDTKSKDYIVVDGVYHAYLYVTGYGYSTTVGSCWLAPLVEAGEGINMSFLVKRQSKEKILSKISQTTMMNRSRMREVGDTRQDYRELHYPIHLLSCDETGARQLQIMAVPYYREKLSRLMLRSAYQPPPEDAPAWDALYNGHPFVIGADMELRRINAAIRMARERNCLPIALAALDAQGSAVLLARYADPGYATVYKVTDGVLTKLFGHAPALYEPPCTQFLTKKGDVVNVPLIKALGKDRGPRCK